MRRALIRSKVALDNFAFWLLPTVARADVVIGDTWSMSPILLRALQMTNSHAHLECFANCGRMMTTRAVYSLRFR